MEESNLRVLTYSMNRSYYTAEDGIQRTLYGEKPRGQRVINQRRSKKHQDHGSICVRCEV